MPTGPLPERFAPGYIPAAAANAMLGLRTIKPTDDPRRRPLTQPEVDAVTRQTDPRVLRFDDEIAQVNENYLIRKIADDIEEECQKRSMPLPTVHAVHTGGIHNPFPDAQVIGRYAEDKPLELLPAADIPGHSGFVTLSMIDNKHSYMAWEGRGDHSYEWLRQRYGDIVASRKINVIMELVRRQRERGENPIVIITFMAGVAEKNPLVPGDLALIVADLEEAQHLSTYLGHQAITERHRGSRFQPKWGRLENPGSLALQKAFLNITRKLNIGAGPMAILGDAEATSFEDWLNYARSTNTFKTALKLGFASFAKRVFENPDNVPDRVLDILRAFLTFRQNWLAQISSNLPVDAQLPNWKQVLFSMRSHEPSLGWGMDNSQEPDALRRLMARGSSVFKGQVFMETEIPSLLLGVLTDSVGPHDSPNADHLKFIDKAEAGAPRYASALKELAIAVAAGQINLPQPALPIGEVPFSLQENMFYAAREQEPEIAEEVFGDKPFRLPQTQGDVMMDMQENARHHDALAKNYDAWGYPDAAQMHRDRAEMFKIVDQSLGSNGWRAYEFYMELRNALLKNAQARIDSIKYIDIIPHQYVANGKLTAESQEERRLQQLQAAQWCEYSLRAIAASHPNTIQHVPLEFEIK